MHFFEVYEVFVIMANGKKLTDHEKGKIEPFSKTGINSRTVELKIRR